MNATFDSTQKLAEEVRQAHHKRTKQDVILKIQYVLSSECENPAEMSVLLGHTVISSPRCRCLRRTRKMSHDPAKFELMPEAAPVPEKGRIGVVGTEDLFGLVYDVLTKVCGASDRPYDREHFVVAQCAEGHPTEWRFCGSLGFGGKFWRKDGIFYVTCYREDETPARLKTIAEANRLLSGLCPNVEISHDRERK